MIPCTLSLKATQSLIPLVIVAHRAMLYLIASSGLLYLGMLANFSPPVSQGLYK